MPGVVVYTPSVGDILYDGWFEIIEAWNGGAGQHGDFFLASGAAAHDGKPGAFGNTPGLGVPMPLNIDAGDVFTGPGYNNFRASQGSEAAMLSAVDWAGAMTAQSAAQYQRNIPGKWAAVDLLVVLVSSDGSNTGDDPGATQGALIVHLLVIPA